MEKMSFEWLVQRLESIPCDERRKQYRGYFEFVLSGGRLPQLYPILEEYFGVPFKPAGVKPTREVENCARSYGGILKQQTLYFCKHKEWSNCAMIWPWSDGSRATVKVAQGVIGEGKN